MLVANFLRKTSVGAFPVQTLCRAVSSYGSLDSGLVNPAFIDVALSQLLKNKKAKKNDINEFIDHFKTRMNRQNFISLLHGCRRRRLLEPRHIYTAACGLKYAEDEPLNSAQLQQVFASLSFMSHRVASSRVLLTVTTEALSACNDKFNVDQVANFLFSLNQMKSGVPEVREALGVIMSKFAECNESISGESASKLIGGFRGLSCKYTEVQQALEAVVARLESSSSDSVFSEADLSRALGGLRRLDLERDESQRLVSVVLGKAGGGSMSGHQLEVALLAAECCDHDSETARALLRCLTLQVAQVDAATPFSARNVGDAVAALEASGVNSEEVTSLVAALEKISA